MIGPGGLLLVVSHLPICNLSFSFMGVIAKKLINQTLDVRTLVDILSTVRD
jgi:hypothetical protein